MLRSYFEQGDSLCLGDTVLIKRSGPWKGGRGAGRARRGLSVITGQKNRVRVPTFEYHRDRGTNRAKNRN